MTVSDAIITWLKTFENDDLWEMNKIDTGIQSANTLTYALAKEPVVNVKRYLSGKEERTEYYQLSARLDTQTDADRIDNGEWFESLEEWVFTQNKEENFPVITDATVTSIKVTSGFYIGQTSENSSVYMITLEIKYNR